VRRSRLLIVAALTHSGVVQNARIEPTWAESRGFRLIRGSSVIQIQKARIHEMRELTETHADGRTVFSLSCYFA